jgi:hypothetical protein
MGGSSVGWIAGGDVLAPAQPRMAGHSLGTTQSGWCTPTACDEKKVNRPIVLTIVSVRHKERRTRPIAPPVPQLGPHNVQNKQRHGWDEKRDRRQHQYQRTSRVCEAVFRRAHRTLLDEYRAAYEQKLRDEHDADADSRAERRIIEGRTYFGEKLRLKRAPRVKDECHDPYHQQPQRGWLSQVDQLEGARASRSSAAPPPTTAYSATPCSRQWARPRDRKAVLGPVPERGWECEGKGQSHARDQLRTVLATVG